MEKQFLFYIDVNSRPSIQYFVKVSSIAVLPQTSEQYNSVLGNLLITNMRVIYIRLSIV